MKQKTRHLYYLFYPRSWIIIALLFCNAAMIAQETPSPEFPIATPVFDTLISNPDLFNSFKATGFNTIWQRAEGNTQSMLENYNLLAVNAFEDTEYVHHYSSAYYSKWEAEQNQTDQSRVGVKHIGGSKVYYDSAWCWSTIGLSAPACSLMYGPHYRQEKRYKRWHYGCINEPGCVTYTPRFRMALDNPTSVDSTEDVCVIKVVFRYKVGSTFYDTTFIKRTLKVGDFDTTGELEDFYLHPNPQSGWYEYYPNFILPKDFAQLPGTPSSINYIDWESFTGIQFWVDWLRTDNLCTLYIDYAEVYDNYGWNDFIDDPDGTAQLIKDYAYYFKSHGWDNIKYWIGPNEPYTIDSYTPMHLVDSLIRSVQAPPLAVHFDPSWTYNFNVNGEDEIEMFYNIAKPARIILGVYPALESWPVIRPYDFEWLRFNLQRTSALDPGFWFKAQTFGWRRTTTNNSWCIWRKPEPPELISLVMLALAHGAKGIDFEWFDSDEQSTWSDYCQSLVYIECLVDNNGDPVPNDPSALYYTVKNYLIPRLKGKLGKALMNLDYTGNYLKYFYFTPNTPIPDPPSYDYLTLGQGEPSDDMNWHCGFFERPGHPHDKYFMLANLITTEDMSVPVKIKPLDIDNYNIRFRNIEGYFDTTFTVQMIKYLTHPKGEGYFYEVAPVIKYGGRLLYSESTQPGITLEDDMTIENGAVLTVNGTYTSKGNITVKNGGIINGSNGKIQFVGGKKLIIEGSGSITGTSNSKLQLEFSEPIDDEPIGMVIKSGGSLTINNCKILDATIGINSLLNANYLNAQNVDFINCETHSISIAGRSPRMLPTPPPQINGCTMINSNYGIFITNLPGMLIQNNIITNAACGIYLSNVTDGQVINNVIQSNRAYYPGVWLFSSGGAIRVNYISGHTVGIHLANSSPILGSNRMTSNKYHGLYIGDGSRPYMRQGQWIGIPPNMYATSGYNKIYDNGGYEDDGGPEDNDGSEIYFVNSNAVMSKGCNSIYDNREPDPPLANTYLLMNCPAEVHTIYVDARGNYWGYRVEPERFGNLQVDFIPFLDQPCPEPQDPSADELVRMTSFGDVIDTVYSVDVEVPELTETEEAYAEAEEYFLTGDLTNALQIYQGIINCNAPEEEKYLAYERKYEIGKLTGQSTDFFNVLSNTFSTLASNTLDTLDAKILNQLSTLSKVGEQEYGTAIGEFDGIIQRNPNTEEAVYAEIDALTTALLVEGEDSTLQKGRLGKYLVKTSGDYNQRIDEILRKNFGSKAKETEEELLPTEYTLYQNYPNPFNPTTTIKYDLPNTSEVSLVIYDILGRKVKELVNTKQEAGRYEIQFNATNLASGVYIYQLLAEKYISSKKMILLK